MTPPTTRKKEIMQPIFTSPLIIRAVTGIFSDSSRMLVLDYVFTDSDEIY